MIDLLSDGESSLLQLESIIENAKWAETISK